MGKLNSIALPLLLIFFISFFVFTLIPTAISFENRGICSYAPPCGQGLCREISPFAYTCDCDRGWQKAKFGTFELQACVLPNCTVNNKCPATSAMAPAERPPTFESLHDINTTACSLAYCGAGQCEMVDNDFKCVCNPEAMNINGVAKLPCLHKCHIGVDCEGFHIDLPAFLPP